MLRLSLPLLLLAARCDAFALLPNAVRAPRAAPPQIAMKLVKQVHGAQHAFILLLSLRVALSLTTYPLARFPGQHR